MRRALGLALVAMMLVVGCADDSQAVALTMEARVEDRSIVVEGTTDLPDGALIAYEVTHDDFATSDATMDLFADGTVPVDGGSYSVTTPVPDWPPGDVTVWVAFQTLLASDQPADVVERYGVMGEHLSGSNITESGGLKRVELERTISLTDE